MLPPRRLERHLLRPMLIALLIGGHGVCRAEAPPSSEKPWDIPPAAIARAADLAGKEAQIDRKPYDLPSLVDLAERINPETHAAWQAAREAAAAEGARRKRLSSATDPPGGRGIRAHPPYRYPRICHPPDISYRIRGRSYRRSP